MDMIGRHKGGGSLRGLRKLATSPIVEVTLWTTWNLACHPWHLTWHLLSQLAASHHGRSVVGGVRRPGISRLLCVPV